MEKARYNTELYSNLREPLNNVKPSNFWGSHQFWSFLLYLLLTTDPFRGTYGRGFVPQMTFSLSRGTLRGRIVPLTHKFLLWGTYGSNFVPRRSVFLVRGIYGGSFVPRQTFFLLCGIFCCSTKRLQCLLCANSPQSFYKVFLFQY